MDSHKFFTHIQTSFYSIASSPDHSQFFSVTHRKKWEWPRDEAITVYIRKIVPPTAIHFQCMIFLIFFFFFTAIILQKGREDYNDILKSEYDKAQAGNKHYHIRAWLDSPWQGTLIILTMCTCNLQKVMGRSILDAAHTVQRETLARFLINIGKYYEGCQI